MTELKLKRTGLVTWTLYGPTGNEITQFHRCGSNENAEQEARAWASSWIGYSVKLEDEQDQKRN